MTIKECPSCKSNGIARTNSREFYSIGRNKLGLWVNCKYCKSTMLIVDKTTKWEFKK